MKEVGKNKKDFNDFRFAGLNWRQQSNKYLTMDRVSEDETKIVVKVADAHLSETKYGYALILDYSHVVFLKSWQVSKNYYGNEVLLTKEFFNVKEWGEHEEFSDEPENLKFEEWLKTAKSQNEKDVDGIRRNPVRWEK